MAFFVGDRLQGVNVSIAITSPTSSPTYNNGTTSTINLSGVAASDRGIGDVTWSNASGGSGRATGTTSWSITGISLIEGSNVITVTARDGAGTTATDQITVTREQAGEGEVFFAMTPDDPNNGGTLFYGFATKWGTTGVGYRFEGVDQPPGSGPAWSLSHDPTGNWDGTGCPFLTMFDGWDQYNCGWRTPTIMSAPALGTPVYIRFRVKYHDDFRWVHYADGAAANKFIMMPGPASGVDRTIIHMRNPSGSSAGCVLGGHDGAFNLPDEYGITVPGNTWDHASIDGLYGSIEINQNVGGENFPNQDCAGPVLQTHAGREGGTSDGWYHVQVRAQGGLSNDAEYEIWVNNNDEGNSDYSKIGGFNQDCDTWTELDVGGYPGNWGANNGYWLGGFEVGDSFDPNWYPGGEDALFSTDFSDPNDGGTDFYGFPSKQAFGDGGGDYWSVSFQPTGNYDGTGCARVSYLEDIPLGVGKNVGWNAINLGETWEVGDSIFFRVRFKWVSGECGSGFSHKMIIADPSQVGGEPGEGGGRSMFFFGGHSTGAGLDRPIEGQFCDGNYPSSQPDDFGLTLPGNTFASHTADYMGCTTMENVSNQPRSALPNLCITRAGVTPVGNVSYDWNRHGATTYNGGAPTNGGWYHYQAELKSGAAGVAYIKTWLNNNIYAQPQSIQVLDALTGFCIPDSAGLGVGGWNFWDFGAYVDTPAVAPWVMDYGGFEISRTFRADWYPE